MCGIVSYTGHSQAAPILLDGLSKLEYRGYDSAGLAVRDGVNATKIVKAKGRLKALSEKTDHGHALAGTCGIGHTRWATHGEPSETNAHPHTSEDGNVVGVHNGIIENYQELKNKLLRKGYTFYSSTDTEVAVKLIDYYYKKYEHISLIEDGTLVIGVLTQSELYEKTISNMVECKSRGAYLMGLTTYGNYNIEDTASFTVYVPKIEECFATSLAVIPLQLMGYYVSVAKGLDVDKPRNLAKSVTVE